MSGSIARITDPLGAFSATLSAHANVPPEEIPQKAWDQLLVRNPPGPLANPRALLQHVNELVDRILLEEIRAVPAAFGNFVRALAAQVVSVAAQGIVVAGTSTPEVRILNNSVADVTQGIHLGLSKQAVRAEHLKLGMVTVAGNRVDVVLAPEAAKKERHGIFVGNCDSLMVENNHVSLQRLRGTESFLIDGIRVWGELGDRAMITQNHLYPLDGNQKRSFSFGIDFNPLVARQPVLWLAMFNVAPSIRRTIKVTNGAVAVAGTNVP